MFDRALLSLPHIKQALALLSFSALLEAAAIATEALALAHALSSIWAHGSIDAAFAPLAVFLAAYCGQVLVAYVTEASLDRYAMHRTDELREQLLTAVLSAQSPAAEDAGSASLATTAIEGLAQVETYLRVILPKAARMAAVSIPLLICAYVLDWVSGIILTLMFPVAVMFMILIGRMANERAEKQYASYHRLANHFIDALRGLRTLKLFGVGKQHVERVYDSSERFREATMKTMGTATLSSGVLDLIATLGVAAVSIMLGIRLLNGQLDLFTGLAALILAPEYFKPLREFAGDFHATLDGKNAFAAIRRITAAPPPVIDDTEPLAPWGSASVLSLENIGFAYDDAAALDGISFEARGYVHIGIIGESGAGKSTLADILAGFKNPGSGSILADGKALRTLRFPSWQDQVAYIPQNPHIFAMSLRDNIRFYKPDSSDEAIAHAVAAVGLESLVAQLPDGLDTRVGEGGRTLSGGEAHRVALARAILADDRRILVFDEPTAHLDVETELELKRRMVSLMEGRLVLFATHRLHWISEMDYVIELEHGTIAWQGTASSYASRTTGGAR